MSINAVFCGDTIYFSLCYQRGSWLHKRVNKKHFFSYISSEINTNKQHYLKFEGCILELRFQNIQCHEKYTILKFRNSRIELLAFLEVELLLIKTLLLNTLSLNTGGWGNGGPECKIQDNLMGGTWVSTSPYSCWASSQVLGEAAAGVGCTWASHNVPVGSHSSCLWGRTLTNCLFKGRLSLWSGHTQLYCGQSFKNSYYFYFYWH